VRALQEADVNFEEGYQPLEGSPQGADGHALRLAVSLHLYRILTQVKFFHFFLLPLGFSWLFSASGHSCYIDCYA
jgi:hypothetical protein